MDDGSDGGTGSGEKGVGNRRHQLIPRYGDSAHMRHLYTMTMGIAWNATIIVYTESKTIRKARRHTMSQFYTSVAHERGFASGDAFVYHWCEQYEQQVKRDSDIVYILGDLAIGNRSFMDACDVLDGLPGRKVLVYGNHDACSPIHSHWSKAAYDRAQKTFMRCDSFITRKLADHRLMMSHFPYGVLDGSYATAPRFMEYRLPDMGFPLVHGHTHGTERHYAPNMMHVGWDAWDRLVSEDEVADWLRSLPADDPQLSWQVEPKLADGTPVR